MGEETDYGPETMFQRLAFVECLIYCFYPILCIVLITIASIFKTTIDYYAEFTNVNLNIVPALIISAGCIGFVILLTRFYFKKSIHMEIMCFVVFPILFIFQLIGAVYGCVQSTDMRNYLLKAVERDMGNIFPNYFRDEDVQARFNVLQNELECCGVYSYKDYTNLKKTLPRSCCPTDYLGTFCVNETKPYDSGCASKVYEEITFNVGVLSYVTFGLIGLQILCGVLIGRIIFKHFRERIQRHT